MLTHDGYREWTQEELDADAYLPQCDHAGCAHQAGYACIDCGGFFCRTHAAPGAARWDRCAECHQREMEAQDDQLDCLACEMEREVIERSNSNGER